MLYICLLLLEWGRYWMVLCSSLFCLRRVTANLFEFWRTCDRFDIWERHLRRKLTQSKRTLRKLWELRRAGRYNWIFQQEVRQTWTKVAAACCLRQLSRSLDHDTGPQAPLSYLKYFPDFKNGFSAIAKGFIGFVQRCNVATLYQGRGIPKKIRGRKNFVSSQRRKVCQWLRG